MEQTFDNLLRTAREELKRHIRRYGTYDRELLKDLAAERVPGNQRETLEMALEMYLANQLNVPDDALEALQERIELVWYLILNFEAREIQEADIRDLFLDN